MKGVRNFQNNILALIHLGTSQLKESAPRVIQLTELEGIRVDSDMRSIKLVQLEVLSVQEARNRATALALLTANTRSASDDFIKLFTWHDFTGPQSNATYGYLRRYHARNGLIDDDQVNKLAPSFMTLGQAHNGLIRKREEPYRTLLRAKPKEKKTHLERFIVLGDADPRHVEERLGNELVSNQIMSHLNADGTRNDKASLNQHESEGSPDQAAVLNGPNLQNPTIHVSRNRKTSRMRASVHTLDSEDAKKAERRHRERNLTHGDIATMKQKLQQNRDKIYKINSL